MVFWNASALSMDPKKAVAFSGWVAGLVGAACAGVARLRGTTPAAAAAPSPNPKNFLRDIACISCTSGAGLLTTQGRYSPDSGESTIAKWGDVSKPLERPGEELAEKKPALRGESGGVMLSRCLRVLASCVEGRKAGIRRFGRPRRSAS